MILYLNNAYGFIRHGIRVTLYAWYEKLLPGMIVLHAMITYHRSFGTRKAFVQEAVSFSYPRATRPLRQADFTLKNANPQARPAGSTRGSAKDDPRGMVD